MSVFTENAAAFATTPEQAINHERRSTIRKTVDLLVAGKPGRARYELARSLHRQARMAGINLDPEPVNPLAVGHFCDGCGVRLERMPASTSLWPCPMGCDTGGVA